MKQVSIFSAAWLLLFHPVYALVGYDQAPYDPFCAHACGTTIWSNMLSCSDPMEMSHDMTDNSPMTSPECQAGDTAYLTTLAWCMDTRCSPDHVPVSTLDLFWESQATSDPKVPPKWTYAQALQNVTQPPTRVLNSDEILNFTALTNDSLWAIQYNTMRSVIHEETLHATFGIVILVTGFSIPIALTWLGYLPFMTAVLEKMRPYIVYPAIIGTYHVHPLPYLLGNAPTAGQGLYIAAVVILNVILTAVGYETVNPHAWYANTSQEILAYVMWRTGVLAFAILPLVILFAGRNNILLWLSNWSHSTYLLLHRWLARIFGIHAILHSILALALYTQNGNFAANEKMPWWIWGVVATLTTTVMLVASGLHARRRSYELFLLSHILLAALTLAGCWYHIVRHYGYAWGYQQWLYAACAAWFADRLARALRVLKTGVRRSRVTDLGHGYARVDVPGVRCAAGGPPGRHVYAYFPTLRPLRPWENHPFSLVPTAMLTSFHSRGLGARAGGEAGGADGRGGDVEKRVVSTAWATAVPDDETAAGITFFVKRSTGMTGLLEANQGLLTLLDGPYPNNPTTSILQCDRLLLIGGGIGIAGLLPWLNSHPNAKLCWSVKKTAECLIEALDMVLNGVAEKDVKIGQRLDVQVLLDQEASCGWAKIGVVVCGPGGLCDDVRAAVVATGKRASAIFELEVDAYSW